MSEEWRKEYEPKREIQTEWYGEMIKNIEEEEWRQSLSTAKEGTALGASGISYTMLSKAGLVATKRLLELINAIFKSAIFPRKWKVGHIFPIPKMTEWDYSLASTRPIMLLETARKSLVRII